MDQFAIILTPENAEMIAGKLDDGHTVEDLMTEINYLYLRGKEVVLGIDVLDNGFTSVSYMISRNLFEARNDNNVILNTEEFEYVWSI